MKKKLLAKMAASMFPGLFLSEGCRDWDVNDTISLSIDDAEMMLSEIDKRYPVDEVFDADLKEHAPERVFMTGDKVHYRGTLCIVKKGFDDVVPPNKPYAIHIVPCNEDDDIGRGKGRGGWTHSSNSRLYAVVTGVNCAPESSSEKTEWNTGASNHMDFNERFGRVIITGRYVIYEGIGGTRVLCVVTKGLNPDGDWNKFQGKHYEVKLRPYMSVDCIGGEAAGNELTTNNWDWRIQECRKDEGPLQYVDRAMKKSPIVNTSRIRFSEKTEDYSTIADNDEDEKKKGMTTIEAVKYAMEKKCRVKRLGTGEELEILNELVFSVYEDDCFSFTCDDILADDWVPVD